MKKELGILILLLLVCVTVFILEPKFLSPQNIRNTLNLIGLYGILAIGLGFIIITGGIDLSIGSALALQGILFCLMLKSGLPWPVAVPLAIAVCVLLGLIHAFLITKIKLQPFIVTLCGLLIYRGVARFVTNDATLGAGPFSTPTFDFLTRASFGPIPITFLWLIAIAAVMFVVLHCSVYGRYLFAVGRNEDAARFSGINTNLVIGSAYVLSMALTGFAGILITMEVPSISPSGHATFYELFAIAAAVLGGCSLRGGEGSILGILLGAALLQVLQNLVILLNIPSSLNFAVVGTVILLGVLVDQLLKNRAARKKLPIA